MHSNVLNAHISIIVQNVEVIEKDCLIVCVKMANLIMVLMIFVNSAIQVVNLVNSLKYVQFVMETELDLIKIANVIALRILFKNLMILSIVQVKILIILIKIRVIN